jgi:hypothetical protein
MDMIRVTLPVLAATIVVWPFPAAAAAPAALSSDCGTENLLAGKLPSDSLDLQSSPALVTDGAIAIDGAQWNAGPAAIFSSAAGQVTYDLGGPRAIGAIYAQADANDSYKVSGSLDAAPGSWKLVTPIANVVERGHGLQSRAVEFAPVTVRYLRFGEGVDRPQSSPVDEALRARRIDARNAGALQQGERGFGTSVDELGAELDGDRKAGHAPRVAAPADAVAEVRARVHWVSRARGGDGAVREFVELVLRRQRRWPKLLASYLPEGRR